MKPAASTLAFIVRFVVLGLLAAFVIAWFWPGTGERLRERLHNARARASGATC